MKILVTGITGLVGRHLAQQLRGKGHELCAITRNRDRAERSFGIPCQFFENQIPRDELQSCDAIINLAGENIADGRWTSERKRKIIESRVSISKTLGDQVEALKGTGPGIFISASAVGYYGDRGDELLDENATSGSGFLAEVCRAWEHQTLHRKLAGIRQSALRLGVVLAGDGGALEKMLPAFRLGLGGSLGPGNAWMSWIHIDDLVSLFMHLLEKEISGPVNAVAPEPVTHAGLARALARTLHRPALLSVPAPILRIALGEMSEMLLASARVQPGVALSTGFRFKFPSIDIALSDLLT